MGGTPIALPSGYCRLPPDWCVGDRSNSRNMLGTRKPRGKLPMDASRTDPPSFTDRSPKMHHFFAIQMTTMSQTQLMFARLLVVFALGLQACGEATAENSAETVSAESSGGHDIPSDLNRSPTDLVVDPTGRWIVTVNETSDSVSLIDLDSGSVADEVSCGDHPSAIAMTREGDKILVSNEWSGEITVMTIDSSRLVVQATIPVGFHPRGIAITQDGLRAFVGLVASGEVAELDLKNMSLVRRFEVGDWPRYLSLGQSDKRLAVGCSGESEIRVFDTESGELLYEEPLSGGINIGHMLTSNDAPYSYFTWMVYRTNPINVGNIRRGWVLASRIGRVRLDGPAYREAISLDVPGQAVSDPHGLAITQDGERLVASASGTHELLVYRLKDLPFVSTGGPGDLIDRRLERDRDRFSRIPLGGRPMGIRAAPREQTIYVANYLRNSVQIVDLATKSVTKEISLGGPSKPSLARQGMAVFYDGTRSLDQWYSCHSCHQDGGINSRPMDTWNDGSEMTLKAVLPLQGITQTKPWTWHGWQTSLNEAMEKSITSTMQGKRPDEKTKQALIAFLESLPEPPNPHLAASGGKLSAAAERGKAVFNGAQAACADCHHGPYFTDGEIHDVGLGSESDVYEGYNTPTLRGLYRKTRWLHSGRAKTLERLLTELHSPEKVSGNENLKPDQVADLIEYLKTL